ncbi:MAG: right-handed parallel beta-helix repeat-containing protein [Acidiferrobacter sp.]
MQNGLQDCCAMRVGRRFFLLLLATLLLSAGVDTASAISTDDVSAPSVLTAGPASGVVGSTISLRQALVVDGAGTGQIYYVSTTGSDGNNGLSPQTAFQTIQHAIEAVAPGDTIELMGGTYAGGITIDHPGTATAWITMEPYQGQQVMIDGRHAMDDVVFDNSTGAPAYWIVTGFTIANAQQYTVQIAVPDVKLVNNDIYGAHNDLVRLVSTAHNVVIWGNQVHNNNAAGGTNAQGIDIVGSQNVLVAHNNVYNVAAIGMYCKGNAGNITFEDNTLNNIYSRGIMLGESTDDQYRLPGKSYESYNSIIKNNVITNAQSACLAESSSYNAEIYSNSCYNTAIDRKGAILLSNESMVGQASTHVYVKDNIVENFSARPMVLIASHAMTDYATLHIDHNMYFDTDGATFEWNGRGLYGAILGIWQSQTGFDAYSTLANPRYASTTTLTVQQASPALRAGIPLAAVRHDLNGTVRPMEGNVSVGAYQTYAP